MGKVWLVGLLLVSLFHKGFSHCGPPINYSEISNLILVAKAVRKAEYEVYDTIGDSIFDFGSKYLFKPVKLLKGRRFRDTTFVCFMYIENEKFMEPFPGDYVIAENSSGFDPDIALGDSIILFFKVTQNNDTIVSFDYMEDQPYGNFDSVIEEINQTPSLGLNEKKRHFNRRYRNVDTTRRVPAKKHNPRSPLELINLWN